MCKYCKNEEIIFKKDIISPTSWGFGGETKIFISEVIENEYGLFIDKRQNATYLRFSDLEDSNCIESGENIEINFCPFCGEKL